MDVEYHKPVNMGNPEEKTVLELATLIKQLTGSKSEIILNPLPIDDPKRRLPDTTVAKKLIQWNPKKDLVEGLTETIAWYRQELSLGDKVSQA